MRIIVLNDGTTYTSAEGCFLIDVDDTFDHNEHSDDMDGLVAWSAEYFAAHPRDTFMIAEAGEDSGLPLDVQVDLIARFI